MTLLEVHKGAPVRIIEIPDERARAQCIRFGICEGSMVDAAEVIAGGPVLLRCGHQEICLGRSLAGRIKVSDGSAGLPGTDERPDAVSGRRARRRRFGRRGDLRRGA